MDLLGRLFIFSPMKENKKFTNVFTQNISELVVMSWQQKFSWAYIATDTAALMETANKFS